MSSRIAFLVTGASGMRLPIHALRALVSNPGIEQVYLAVSRGAAKVLSHELEDGPHGSGATALMEACGLGIEGHPKISVYGNEELDAPIASGSCRLDATVILPCSSSALGALANGTATTLIYRAGTVALKEGWPLILGFRETPLNLVHIENLRRLAYAGATLLPPIPAFYVGGEDLGRFLDAYVMRLLDCIGVPAQSDSELRWHGGRARTAESGP